jgi:hypothetical protein
VTSDYEKGYNKFTGKIDKVTIDLRRQMPRQRERKRKLKRKRPRTPST